MLHEIDFGGIFLPPLLLHALIAAALFFLVRWLLDRAGVLTRIWYQALFELSLFTVIFSTTVFLA